MDIAGISMAMSTSRIQGEVGTAVLSKAMDTSEALGQGMVQMIDSAATKELQGNSLEVPQRNFLERSVNPNVGTNFDMRV